jgi:hypothetical protein
MAIAKKARDLEAELAFLTRALNAPALRLRRKARGPRHGKESWAHKEFRSNAEV